MGTFVLLLRNGDACRETWWFLRCSDCFLVSFDLATSSQWPFQDPIDWRYLHVPTIYILALFLGLNFREYHQKIWPNIWYVNRTSMGSWRIPPSILGKQAIGWPTIEKFPLSCECRQRKSSLLVHFFPWKWHHYEPRKIMKDKIDHGHGRTFIEHVIISNYERWIWMNMMSFTNRWYEFMGIHKAQY